MIKTVGINNMVFFHVIGEDDNNDMQEVYIRLTQMYNLVTNIGVDIVVREAVKENNSKNYKPKSEAIGKIYVKNNKYFLKILIGKGFGKIEDVEDVETSFEVEFQDYDIYSKYVLIEVEKLEEYEKARKTIRKIKKEK
jgi:hypothetical protein